jgi:hypothetical protein
MLATRHSLLSVCHRTRRFLRIKPNSVELAKRHVRGWRRVRGLLSTGQPTTLDPNPL